MFKITTSLTLLLALSACSTTQQDALLKSVTDFGRYKADATVRTIKADDVVISYLERTGNGPVVVLVHGFSANKDTWLSFMAKLPEDWHIIVPDLAGHGETSNPANNNYQLNKQTLRLNAFMKALELPKFHMVGNSMGGAISALYAIDYPTAIASLTLIDSAGLNGTNPSEFMLALKQGSNPLIATDKESFETRWNMIMSKPPFAPWPLRPAMIRQTLKRQAMNEAIFADMMLSSKMLPEEELKASLRQNVTMPVLIMWGDEDRILDVSAAYAFKEQLPQAELEIFSGIGHLPQIEIPKQSAERLAVFIDSIK